MTSEEKEGRQMNSYFEKSKWQNFKMSDRFDSAVQMYWLLIQYDFRSFDRLENQEEILQIEFQNVRAIGAFPHIVSPWNNWNGALHCIQSRIEIIRVLFR